MPSLSIVIPTRNRYESLFPSIEAIVDNIIGDDYDIIVQDNTPDNSPALEYFGAKNYDRVHYFHTPGKLSQSDNSNIALSRATGKYVLFIGDDDTVSPYILSIVSYMDRNNIECLSYMAGVYLWANTTVKRPSQLNKPGLLWMRSDISSTPELMYSKVELQNMLNAGAPSIMSLPRVYHGIVSNSLLQRMKDANGGKYIIGSCPDMNMAVSLAACVDRYHYIKYPVSIGGAAPNSAAGMNARKSHRAYLETMVADGWLPQSVIDNWNPLLPKVWTIPTIYAQSAYEALRVHGIQEEINYTHHYSACLQHESWAYKEICKAMKTAIAQNKSSYFAVLKSYTYRITRHILAVTLKPLIGKLVKRPMPLRFENIATIDECTKKLLEIPFIPDDITAVE